MLPVYITIVWTTVWWTRQNVQKVNALWVKSLGRGYDAMANIFTVKSSAAEDRELESMAAIHREGLAELDKVNRFWAALEGFGYFGLLRLVMIGTGLWLLVRGEISLGSLFFFQFSFFRLVVPFEMLSNMMPRWNELVGKIRLAEDIYNKEIEIESKPDAVTLPDFKGEITLDDVTFSYGDADALRGLTLSIRPGEHIALVGHSGAGKSTVAMLLNRFYDVTSGAILVDGKDLRDLDLQWWRSRIGLVQQENITFNDTIGNNIRYSRPDAADADVIDAATRASAHAFISKLPQGYDTLVGERGIRLSGGERQRVAIARAILKKPDIVILDEATSALDSLTEREVQQGIRSLIEGRTAVIIAHRLSTVRSVDRIAVLENGTLLACAPHDELVKTCDLYRRMVELQQGGILADESEKEEE
jgi:ATP-binding cassette subfamily B protein